MRNLLFLIAAALGALLPSCTPANRVVENPLIATANTQTLDIVKVELSDTATVLHMNAYYRPKNWIVISSDSYLPVSYTHLDVYKRQDDNSIHYSIA